MALSKVFARFTLALVALLISSSGLMQHTLPPDQRQAVSFIIQSSSAGQAADAVVQAGGLLTRRLPIIDGVTALLDRGALARLERQPQLRLHPDAVVQTADKGKETDTEGYLLYPAAATEAYTVHDQQIATRKTSCENKQVSVGSGQEQRELRGWGVTVAVIDSGFMKMKSASDWATDKDSETLYAENAGRCIVYKDFVPRSSANDNTNKNNSTDPNGHGTHVISTIADNRETALAEGAAPTPVGVAPQVNLVIARALDTTGAGTYGQVIDAIGWVLENQAGYNIRVLNLSLYAPVTGPYWADPLNQAVMRAWQAGLVVVAAAGNNGPEAGTITVPGNVPYVITVGAIKSGRYTESGYDELATYSSRGPTESAFVKPDVLVPASRTIAPMPDDSYLAEEVPDARIQESADVDYGIGAPYHKHTYYQLSGTSMAAAQVSGIVALILQANPALTNDQVKYRLMATARPAADQTTGQPTYTIWEQGSGMVDTEQAIFADTTESANAGMDIALDLDTTSEPQTHYWGYTVWDETAEEFKLADPQTGEQLSVWDGGTSLWAGGTSLWAGSNRVWSGGTSLWAGGTSLWAGGTSLWAGGTSLWAGSNRVWSGTVPATSLNTASYGETLVTNIQDSPPPVTPAPSTPPIELCPTGRFCVGLPLLVR